MCILVSARLHATAAPEAPAPMIRTSTGSFHSSSLMFLVVIARSAATNPKSHTSRCWSQWTASLARNDGSYISTHNPHRQRADAANEIRIEPLWRPHDLEAKIARRISSQRMRICCSASRSPTQRWMPAPNARCCRGLARSMMNSSARSILSLVAIAGDVPHHHLVALGDPAAGEFDVVARGAAHVQHRRLIADDFGDQVRDQLAPAAHQFELFRIFDQRHQPTAHGIARGVVAADDQKRNRADEFARLQIAGRFGMREHRDQSRRPAAPSRARPTICGNIRPFWPVRRNVRFRNARRHRAKSTLAIATSDHQVSFMRSSQGKSNSVASIMLVRSIETRSTQSKVSLRGSASSTSDVRLRISGSKLARLDGATIGATVRRCAVCPGGSIRMKFGDLPPLAAGR